MEDNAAAQNIPIQPELRHHKSVLCSKHRVYVKVCKASSLEVQSERSTLEGLLLLMCLVLGLTCGCMLKITLMMIIKLHGHIYPDTANQLLKDQFADEVMSRGDKQKFKRIESTKYPITGKYDGTIPMIFRKGGLELKAL